MNSARQPAHILIVDDERSIADTLAMILKNAGYQTSTAYSGESAIASANVVRPALIISDIQMPGLDGISSSLEIRKILPGCRIILFSGYPEAHSDRARSNGLKILSKPLSLDELLQQVHAELHDQTRRNCAGN